MLENLGVILVQIWCNTTEFTLFKIAFATILFIDLIVDAKNANRIAILIKKRRDRNLSVFCINCQITSAQLRSHPTLRVPRNP